MDCAHGWDQPFAGGFCRFVIRFRRSTRRSLSAIAIPSIAAFRLRSIISVRVIPAPSARASTRSRSSGLIRSVMGFFSPFSSVLTGSK